MKIYYKLIYLFFFLSYNINAQTLQGQVIDSSDKSPISYVAIFDSKSQKGTYTDSLGKFSFSIKNIEELEVQIHRIGYKSRKMKIINLSDNLLIQLESEDNILDEVKITAKHIKYKEKNIGYYNRIRGLYTYDYCPNTASRLATYIYLNEENAYFRKIKIRFAAKKSERALSYRTRLRLMSNKNNLPNQDLINRDIINDIRYNQDYLEQNIEDLGIKIPEEGFWICLDVLGYTDLKGKYQTINTFEYGENKSTIAPWIAMTKGGDGLSVQSAWGSKWFSFKNNYNVFMFGISYLIAK